MFSHTNTSTAMDMKDDDSWSNLWSDARAVAFDEMDQLWRKRIRNHNRNERNTEGRILSMLCECFRRAWGLYGSIAHGSVLPPLPPEKITLSNDNRLQLDDRLNHILPKEGRDPSASVLNQCMGILWSSQLKISATLERMPTSNVMTILGDLPRQILVAINESIAMDLRNAGVLPQEPLSNGHDLRLARPRTLFWIRSTLLQPGIVFNQYIPARPLYKCLDGEILYSIQPSHTFTKTYESTTKRFGLPMARGRTYCGTLRWSHPWSIRWQDDKGVRVTMDNFIWGQVVPNSESMMLVHAHELTDAPLTKLRTSIPCLLPELVDMVLTYSDNDFTPSYTIGPIHECAKLSIPCLTSVLADLVLLYWDNDFTGAATCSFPPTIK